MSQNNPLPNPLDLGPSIRRVGFHGSAFARPESLDEINLPSPVGSSQMIRTLQTFGPQYNQAKLDGKINVFLQYACIVVLHARHLIVPTELERLLVATELEDGSSSALQEFCKLTEVCLPRSSMLTLKCAPS